MLCTQEMINSSENIEFNSTTSTSVQTTNGSKFINKTNSKNLGSILNNDLAVSVTSTKANFYTSDGMIALYASVVIIIILLGMVVAIIINRKRKQRLIHSVSFEESYEKESCKSTKSTEDDFTKMHTELERQHLKKQNADIEDIVKLHAESYRARSSKRI